MKSREGIRHGFKRRLPGAWLGVALLSFQVLAHAQAPPTYTITTLAGNGVHGYAGDAGAATSAQLNYPQGIAVDSSGNIFIADCFNHRVRKVTPDGVISTVAGTGTAGRAGDGAAATSATLRNPCGVAVDSAGNIYIGDTRNHAVRKVATGGTISKLAGLGEAGYYGDGLAAVEAALSAPLGVALDSAGNVYIADVFNHRIRKVATDGKIATVAGNGVVGYSGDDGPATGATLAYPHSVALDAAGNLYIADTHNDCIRKVAPDGTITTVAGSGMAGFAGDGGAATQAQLNYPKGLALDAAGNIFIADTFNNRIRVVTPDGKIATVAGSGAFGDWGDGGPATDAMLRFPTGVAVGPAGRVYIADDQNSRIRLLTPAP